MRKRCIISLFLVICFIFAAQVNVIAQDHPLYDVDFELSSQGIVRVVSYRDPNLKLKVMIQKGDLKYTYNLKSTGTYFNFPLQMGDGNYTVKIYEHVTGTKYKVIYTESKTVDILDENAVYLLSSQQVNWDKNDRAVILASKLTEKKFSQKDKILSIYEYVIRHVDYDYEKIKTLSYDYIPQADAVLEDGKGICYDYAVLLAVMLRSQGIPTKLIKGYSTFTSEYHAWNEIYLAQENRWIIVDPTNDAYMVDHNKPYVLEKSRTDYTTQFEY